jgi:hypothetical protein
VLARRELDLDVLDTEPVARRREPLRVLRRAAHRDMRLERAAERAAAEVIRQLQVRLVAHVDQVAARAQLRERAAIPVRHEHAVPAPPALAARRLRDRALELAFEQPHAALAAVLAQRHHHPGRRRLAAVPRAEPVLAQLLEQRLHVAPPPRRLALHLEGRVLDEAPLAERLERRARPPRRRPRQIQPLRHRRPEPRQHHLHVGQEPPQIRLVPLVRGREHHARRHLTHPATVEVSSGLPSHAAHRPSPACLMNSGSLQDSPDSVWRTGNRANSSDMSDES